MENTELNINLAEQVNIRLRSDKKQTLEKEAKQRGQTLTEWSRNVLLESALATPTERQMLFFFAMGCEVNRLTIVAAQNAEDVSTEASRERIERQAQATAESIVNRWLSLPGFRKGAI